MPSKPREIPQGALDRSFLVKIMRQSRGGPRLPAIWGEANHRLVMIFSDQMVVTGITVLIAGFLPSSQLSIYDFQIVVWLGWIASNCHQVTLTVLRDYLIEHKVVFGFKIAGMIIVWALLLAALIFAGPGLPSDDSSLAAFTADSNVRCSWTNPGRRIWGSDTVLSIILLTINLVARLVKLLRAEPRQPNERLRRRPGDYLRKLYRRKVNSTGRFNALPFLSILAYVTGRAICDIYDSQLFGLLWLTLSFLYGLLMLFNWRQAAPTDLGNGVWGFGQLLAVFGLVLPLIALPGIYAGVLPFPAFHT